MPRAAPPRTVGVMKSRLLLMLLAVLLLVLAIGGWCVEGTRWVLRGRRARLAPA